MTKKPEITQRNFEGLLNWLDTDKDVAAEKYKSIHQRLIQIFLSRNAFPADELADQTMDRAARRLDYLVKEYKGDPALYFYAVANKIFLEYLRKPKYEPLAHNVTLNEVEEDNSYYECMSKCLQGLLPEQRELMIEYFKYRKQTKINHHKKMAKKLKLDLSTMRTRVYRIRMSLEECVREHIQKKSM